MTLRGRGRTVSPERLSQAHEALLAEESRLMPGWVEQGLASALVLAALIGCSAPVPPTPSPTPTSVSDSVPAASVPSESASPAATPEAAPSRPPATQRDVFGPPRVRTGPAAVYGGPRPRKK